MDEESDAVSLDAVVAELERRKGDLPNVAKESGVSYDTVLRIKNRENDPGFSKVRALHEYLFGPPDHYKPKPSTMPLHTAEPEPGEWPSGSADRRGGGPYNADSIVTEAGERIARSLKVRLHREHDRQG